MAHARIVTGFPQTGQNLDAAPNLAHTGGMTYEQAVRRALNAAAEHEDVSDREIRRRLVEDYGVQWGERTINRIMGGDTKMNVQQMELLSAVLDVNPSDVLAEVVPGRGAEYRCSVRTPGPLVSLQVRASRDRRAAWCPHLAHAA